MRARGAKINPSVSLYADPGAGMGLVATRALERDEALMLLPPRTQLRWAEQEADVLSAKQGELQALVAGEVPPNLWDFRLACLLLASQREGGAMRADWGVYADSLPLQVPDLPILWTGARLDAIKDKYPHCAEEVRMPPFRACHARRAHARLHGCRRAEEGSEWHARSDCVC